MFFQQIKQIGDNFSYLVADETTKIAAVIDPSFNAETIIQATAKNGFNIKYIINTHHHKDHTAGNTKIKAAFSSKVVAHKSSKIEKDIGVEEGDILRLGNLHIKIIHTPGHTSDGICLLIDKKLLTGDTLFVGECGRTDLPDSSPKDLYNSLFSKLSVLENDTEVYPGHDYGLRPFSTVGNEKRTNYTLRKRSLKEFLEFMET